MTTSFTCHTRGADKLEISGAITIYAAAELRDVLRQAILARTQLILDLSGIEACDMAGFQVLVSARLTAAQAGKVLRVECASQALENVARDIGLSLTGAC